MSTVGESESVVEAPPFDDHLGWMSSASNLRRFSARVFVIVSAGTDLFRQCRKQ